MGFTETATLPHPQSVVHQPQKKYAEAETQAVAAPVQQRVDAYTQVFKATKSIGAQAGQSVKSAWTQANGIVANEIPTKVTSRIKPWLVGLLGATIGGGITATVIFGIQLGFFAAAGAGIATAAGAVGAFFASPPGMAVAIGLGAFLVGCGVAATVVCLLNRRAARRARAIDATLPDKVQYVSGPAENFAPAAVPT